MANDAVITVRVPRELKQKIAARAKREHRSVSAQVVHELDRALGGEVEGSKIAHRSALGMFAGARVPSDAEFAAVRTELWGRLDKRG